MKNRLILLTLILWLGGGMFARDQTPSEQIVYVQRWSPDGQRLASGSESGVVTLRTLASGQSLVIPAHLGPIREITWSPDGSRIATSSDGNGVRIWNASTGRLVKDFPEIGSTTTIGWSPDGTRLFVLPYAGDGYVIAATLAPDDTQDTYVILGTFFTPTVAEIIWSPDGSRIAVDWGSTVSLRDAQFNLIRTLGNIEPDYSSRLAWHPNNQLLAIGTYGGEVYTVDTTAAQPVFSLPVQGGHPPRPESPEGMIFGLFFSADGTTLTSISRDGYVKTWNAATLALVSVTYLGGAIYGVAISPDQTRLAYDVPDDDPTPIIRALPPTDQANPK